MKVVDGVLTYVSESDLINGELCVPKDVKSISSVVSKKLRNSENFTALSFEQGSEFNGFCDSQFSGCGTLEKIDLSNCKNLSVIPFECFYNCWKLSEIDFPSGLKEIGAGAFKRCWDLNGIDFEKCKGLRLIGNEAFMKCFSLSEVNLSNLPIEEIGDLAFSGCVRLGSFDISGCDKLKRLGKFFISASVVDKFDMRGANNVKEIGTVWALRCGEFNVGADLIGAESGSFSDCFVYTTKINVFDKNNNKLFTFDRYDDKLSAIKIVSLGLYRMAEKAGIELNAKQLNLFCSKDEFAVFIKNYDKVMQLCKEMTRGCSVLYNADISALSLLRMLGYFGVKNAFTGEVNKAELDAYKALLAKDLVRHKLGDLDKVKGNKNKEYIETLINGKVNKVARSMPLEQLVEAFVRNNIIENPYRKNLIYENLFFKNKSTINLQFAEFFVANFNAIMEKKVSLVKENEEFNVEYSVGVDGKRRLSSIYNDFDMILSSCKKKVLSRSNNQRLNLADCEFENVYSGVLAGNEELAKYCGRAHMSQSQFEKAQGLFEKGKVIKSEQVLRVRADKSESDVKYRFIGKDDPLGLVLGNLTNCCQRIGGVGESCVVVGETDPNSGFVVIECGGEIVAQSWVWYDDKTGTIALDNIEVPDICDKVVNYGKKDEVRACIGRLCDNLVTTMRANGAKVDNVVIGCNATDVDSLCADYFLETSAEFSVKCPFVVDGVMCYSDVFSEGQYVVYRNGKPFTKDMGKAEKERRKQLILNDGQSI